MISDTCTDRLDGPDAPRGGFTIIEMLVVLAVMAMLAAMIVAGMGPCPTAGPSTTKAASCRPG